MKDEDFDKYVAYVYGNEEEAKNGIATGASGFFVTVEYKYFGKNRPFSYFVTNNHVLQNKEKIFVRLNTKYSGPKVVEIPKGDFKNHGSKDISCTNWSNEGFKKGEVYSFHESTIITEKIFNLPVICKCRKITMITREVKESVEQNQYKKFFGYLKTKDLEDIKVKGFLIRNLMKTSIESQPGMSGSPVTIKASDGLSDLLGMNCGKTKEGSNVVVPSWVIIAFIKEKFLNVHIAVSHLFSNQASEI